MSSRALLRPRRGGPRRRAAAARASAATTLTPTPTSSARWACSTESPRPCPAGRAPRGPARDGRAGRAARARRARQAVVEAGTGIGKSLAYLVPSALVGARVVVATATKNLQDQLATKDAPRSPRGSRASRVAVLKGRQNYLCRQRATAAGAATRPAGPRRRRPPRRAASPAQLRRILRWSTTTATGDRDELDFEVDERAWRRVSVTRPGVPGADAVPPRRATASPSTRATAPPSPPTSSSSTPTSTARTCRRAQTLLPAHDARRASTRPTRPSTSSRALLGTSVSARRALRGPGRRRGTAAQPDRRRARRRAAPRRRPARPRRCSPSARRRARSGSTRTVVAELGAAGGLVVSIVDALRALSPPTVAGEERTARALGPGDPPAPATSRALTSARDDELVYLEAHDREVDRRARTCSRWRPRLRDELWGEVTAVLSSAHDPRRAAADRSASTTRASSACRAPSTTAHHALLYVPADFPDRARRGVRGRDRRRARRAHRAPPVGGPSRCSPIAARHEPRSPTAVAARVATPVLVQGEASRARLLARLPRRGHGEPLRRGQLLAGRRRARATRCRLVAIDRLPFGAPDDPLARGTPRARRPSGFCEVDLPRAAMLLAQGVGRLIRTREDRGVVAVLDTRLATASYRAALLRPAPADAAHPRRATRSSTSCATSPGPTRKSWSPAIPGTLLGIHHYSTGK